MYMFVCECLYVFVSGFAYKRACVYVCVDIFFLGLLSICEEVSFECF